MNQNTVSASPELSLRDDPAAAATLQQSHDAVSRLVACCSHCAREFRVRAEKQGRKVLCPKCGQSTLVAPPAPAPALAAPAPAPPPIWSPIRLEQPEPEQHRLQLQQELRRKKKAEYQKQEQAELERRRIAEACAAKEAEEKRIEQARVRKQEQERRLAEATVAREAEERRLEEVRLRQEEAAESAKAEAKRREQDRLRQLEEQRRLAEEKRRLAEAKAAREAEEAERQAEIRRREQEEREQQLREQAEARRRAEEERIRVCRAAWQTLFESSQEVCRNWVSQSRSVSRQNQLSERTRAFQAWQLCNRTDPRYAEVFPDFERAEKIRWTIERAQLETALTSSPGERFVPAIRNRWGTHLDKQLVAPVKFTLLGCSWPLSLVAVNPVADSDSAFPSGLEFVIHDKLLKQLREPITRENDARRIVASLFQFQLPREALPSLRRCPDAGSVEVLSYLNAMKLSRPALIKLSAARHAVALYWMNVALLREVAFVSGFLSSATGYWDLALSLWTQLLEDEQFWSSLAETHQKPQVVNSLRGELQWFLAVMILQLAQKYAECNQAVAAERLLSIVRRSSLPAECRDAGTVAAVRGSFH